jgi:tetratricopeptide (TPR) repeat protein
MLRDGKKEEAFREIEKAKQLQPVYLELPISLVAELERAGEKERAQKHFDEVFGKWEQACRDYPNCADAHNQLAWLSCRCRRNLDAALEHARKAVELAPTIPSYRDTMAEVYFQRGDKAQALELMKKCLKMYGANLGFYQRQLRRLERGDPKEEPPSEL